MFQDAQTAMREHNIRTRERVLAKYGPQAHRLAVASEADNKLATDPLLDADLATDRVEDDA